MTPFLGAMIGSGAFGLANSALNIGASGQMNYRSYKRQQKLMNQQHVLNEQSAQSAFDRSMQFWNQQNEYNSPSAMMRRYKDAGLNENLIYGNSSGNTAGGLPSAPQASTGGATSASGMSVGNIGNLVASMLSARNQLKQGKLIDAQARESDARASSYSASAAESLERSLGYSIRRDRDSFELGLRRQMRDDLLQNQVLLNKRLQSGSALDTATASLRRIDANMRSLEYKDYQAGIRPGDPWYIRSGLHGLRQILDRLDKSDSFGGQLISAFLGL